MELWTSIFAKTKAPLTPLYGGFPVKLKTHLGDFIDSTELTTDELRAETLIAMQKLIKKHQKLPGNVVRAIKERLQSDIESDNEDFVECQSDIDEFESLPGNIENISDTLAISSEKISKSCCESESFSDSGNASVATSVDENDQQSFKADNFITIAPSIIQLPNGRLVLSINA
jgi:hypothetical protein